MPDPLKTRPVIVVGAGGHARVVASIFSEVGQTMKGFIDGSQAVGSPVAGLTVLGSDEILLSPSLLKTCDYIVAIGEQSVRRRLALILLNAGARLAIARHPSCVVSRDATVGDGSMLIAGVIVNTAARIGRFCIVNTAASVDHDCIVADNVQIGPGARITGSVTLGENVVVGAGAVIGPGITIGTNAIIGAGAVVLHDVAPNTFVAGVPARVIRSPA